MRRVVTIHARTGGKLTLETIAARAGIVGRQLVVNMSASAADGGTATPAAAAGGVAGPVALPAGLVLRKVVCPEGEKDPALYYFLLRCARRAECVLWC